MDTHYREAYVHNYLRLIGEANQNGHVLNISTITLIAALNKDKLDLEHFCRDFTHPQVRIKTIDQTKRKYFFNQITLNYKDISKKSIKIFSNGKLQITGLTSVFECNRLLNLIQGWLSSIFKDNIRIINSYIGMINGNFSIKKTINLLNMNYLLCNNEGVLCIYNPESYPAINIKLNHNGNTISVFVFGTGNIVITGGKSLNDINHAYTFIINVLSKYPEVYKESDVVSMKKEESIIHGYTIRQFLSCLV